MVLWMGLIAGSNLHNRTIPRLMHLSFVAPTITILGDLGWETDGESVPGRREVQGWMDLQLSCCAYLLTDERARSSFAVDGSLGSRYKQYSTFVANVWGIAVQR